MLGCVYSAYDIDDTQAFSVVCHSYAGIEFVWLKTGHEMSKQTPLFKGTVENSSLNDRP